MFVLTYNHKFGREKRRQLDEYCQLIEKYFWENDCIYFNVLNILGTSSFFVIAAFDTQLKQIYAKEMTCQTKCINFST